MYRTTYASLTTLHAQAALTRGGFVTVRLPEIPHNSKSMFLRLLDTPHLEFEGTRLEIAPTKPAALMLYLAMQGDWVDRERLVAMFAPNTDESGGRHHVRVLLNRAKQLKWVENLETEPTRVRFQIQSDVQAFREAIGRGDHLEAVKLYKKPLLDDFRIDAPDFEVWCSEEREAFSRAWREAAQKHAQKLRKDDPAAAARLLHGVLENDDLAEDILHSYLESAYLSGSRDEALRTFEKFKQHLKLELDLEPLSTTVQLAQTMRRAEPLILESLEEVAKPKVPLNVLRPPHLTGRKRELEALLAAKSNVTLVAAESGAGKTRLLEEALPNARWLRCREGLESVPYYPVLELLRTNLEQLHTLGVFTEDLARLIPELLPDVSLNPTDPSTAKVRLLEALSRAFEINSSPLVLDDLQWADSSSLEFLVFFSSRKQIRVFGTYRSNEINTTLEQTLNSLRSNQDLEIIKLKALGQTQMRELLADLIGIQHGPERFAKWLAERSGGNVFFALEMLRSLFETGMLEVRDSDWHSALDEITNDYSELEVPPAISQLIARRFARLSEGTQRLLSAASVVSEGFNPNLFSSLIGLSEWNVIELLEEAEQHGFLEGKGFSHDLFRQCLYQQLPDIKRKYLHGKIAQTLQGIAEPLILAEHWRKAEELQKAWQLEILQAKQQFERGLLNAGFETLKSLLNEAPSQQPERLEALVMAGGYMLFLDISKADAFHQEALKIPTINSELRLRANLGLSENAVYRGDMLAAKHHVQNAKEDITENTNSELVLLYQFARLEIMLRSGFFDQADALLVDVYALEPWNLRTATYQAQLRYYQARFFDAVQIFEDIRNQDPNSVYKYTLENDLAVSYWWIGEIQKAEHEALLSLEHWRGSPHVEALSHMHMGFIRLSQGRFQEALDYLQQAKTEGQNLGSITFQGDIENRFAVVYFHAGRLALALQHNLKALELMRSVGDPYRESTILGIMVAIYASLGDQETAEHYLLEAQQSTTKSQNHAAQSFLIQAQGVLSLQKGNILQARAYFKEVEIFARQTQLLEFLTMNLLLCAKFEPEPSALLNEALEIAVAKGFKLQEYFAALALGDNARTEECLDFLRKHAPDGWF